MNLTDPPVLLLCSTPFGAIEGFTNKFIASWMPDTCAQRLSASSKGSQQLVPGGVAVVDVLNAVRHHRRVHATTC